MGWRFINVTPGCKYVCLSSILQTAPVRDVDVSEALLVSCSLRQMKYDYMDELMWLSLLHLLLIFTRSFPYQCKEDRCQTAWLVLEHIGPLKQPPTLATVPCFVNSMKITTRCNRYWHSLSLILVDFLCIPLARQNKYKLSQIQKVKKKGYEGRKFLNLPCRTMLLGLHTAILLPSSLLTITFRDRMSQGGRGLAWTRIHYFNPITLNRKSCPRKRHNWKSWVQVLLSQKHSVILSVKG